MRTTLSLEEDVAVQLQRLRRTRQISLKQLINEALRLGLRQMTAREYPGERYETRPVSLGRCLIGTIDDVSESLAVAEGDSFR